MEKQLKASGPSAKKGACLIAETLKVHDPDGYGERLASMLKSIATE